MKPLAEPGVDSLIQALPAPMLRPWWHVGIPFFISAGVFGVVGSASHNRATPWLCLLFIGWGLVWSLLARRGAARHLVWIQTAVANLGAPGPDDAIWLGSATLSGRPRRPGHLLWTTQGFVWTPREMSSLADSDRRVRGDEIVESIALAFADLRDVRHVAKALSGEQLTLIQRNGTPYRFRLAEPLTYAFVHRVLVVNEGP